MFSAFNLDEKTLAQVEKIKREVEGFKPNYYITHAFAYRYLTRANLSEIRVIFVASKKSTLTTIISTKPRFRHASTHTPMHTR